jgi:hypothetical protein
MKIFFLFFAVKLDHVKAQTIFSHVSNTQPLQQKSENKDWWN